MLKEPNPQTLSPLVGEAHVRRYLETDGNEGYIWNGVPILILTTTGRRTGLPRAVALTFGTADGDYLVVASNTGAAKHPEWYLNLRKDNSATIQVRGERLAVTSRTATYAEKPWLWKRMTDLWPNYDEYQARTERSIPVVVLTP